MSEYATTLALVDQHPIIGIGVRALLQQDSDKDFTLVHHATRANDILDFYSHRRTDLLLLDLNLPDMEYKDLIKGLQIRVRDTKIMAYTAYNNSSLVKTVLRLGLDGYLLKTCTPEEFIYALHQVMERDEVYIGKSVQLNSVMNSPRKGLKDDFQKCLSLSKREKEILDLISQGYTSQSISKTLFISKYTVETHRKNILRKLNFNSSTELVKFAVQQGLV